MPIFSDIIRSHTLRSWASAVSKGEDPLDWQILVQMKEGRSGFGYIPIPKAANTTMRTALLPCYDISSEDVLDVHHDDRIDKRRLRGALAELPDSGFLFTVVRHPAKRIYSAWQDKIQRKRKFGHAGRLGIKQFTSFDQFLLTLAQVPPTQLDSHFRPQEILLHHALNDPRLKIYKTEALAAKWAEIAAEIKASTGCEMGKMPHKNTTKTGAPHYKFTASQKRIIELIYWRDFERFEYDWSGVECER